MHAAGHTAVDARRPWECGALASGIISALVQLATFGYFAFPAAPHMRRSARPRPTTPPSTPNTGAR